MKEMLCNVSLRSAKLRGGATAVEAVQSITVVQKYFSSAARAGVWGLAPIKERGGGCARQDTEDSLPTVTSWLSVLECGRDYSGASCDGRITAKVEEAQSSV